jgi:hypothetical protein
MRTFSIFTLVTMVELNANDNSIFDGLPMSLEQMRLYLQELYCIPIALREQGTQTIKCPYCLQHESQPGRHLAGCGDAAGAGLVIGDSYYVKNDGYTICEYKKQGGVNELIIPDNLLDD